MDLFRPDDSFVFHKITGSVRKPIVRFHLACGRQVELIAFHLEPARQSYDSPNHMMEEIAKRLHPSYPIVIAANRDLPECAFACVALFYSDTPTEGQSNGLTYSSLIACGLITNIDRGIRAIATELLSKIDWERHATDDVMW